MPNQTTIWECECTGYMDTVDTVRYASLEKTLDNLKCLNLDEMQYGNYYQITEINALEQTMKIKYIYT